MMVHGARQPERCVGELSREREVADRMFMSTRWTGGQDCLLVDEEAEARRTVKTKSVDRMCERAYGVATRIASTLTNCVSVSCEREVAVGRMSMSARRTDGQDYLQVDEEAEARRAVNTKSVDRVRERACGVTTRIASTLTYCVSARWPGG